MSKLLGVAEPFEKVSREWYERHVTSLSAGHARRILAYLETYLFPCLGQRSIDVITAPELLSVIMPVANRSPKTAHRVMSACNRIFRFAFQAGLIEGNPVDGVRGVIPPVARKPVTVPDTKDIGPILAAIDGYAGSCIIKAAMQLAPLLIVRPEELRLAEWGEVDFEAMNWNIPAERRMRMLPHVVPLSYQALSILRKLYMVTGTGRYVFASPNSPHMCITAVSIHRALRIVGCHMPLHSFRRMGAMVLYEIAYSAASRPPIPIEVGHPFRFKPAIYSV
ncbi:tyrosine-type recombinase/integrase [Geomonas sp. Red276]